jgi:hypothetical protein
VCPLYSTTVGCNNPSDKNLKRRRGEERGSVKVWHFNNLLSFPVEGVRKNQGVEEDESKQKEGE